MGEIPHLADASRPATLLRVLGRRRYFVYFWIRSRRLLIAWFASWPTTLW
jgi:hypothetical protein